MNVPNLQKVTVEDIVNRMHQDNTKLSNWWYNRFESILKDVVGDVFANRVDLETYNSYGPNVYAMINPVQTLWERGPVITAKTYKLAKTPKKPITFSQIDTMIEELYKNLSDIVWNNDKNTIVAFYQPLLIDSMEVRTRVAKMTLTVEEV